MRLQSTTAPDQTYPYPSKSRREVTYRVTLRAADGRISCDCFAWTRKRGDVRGCTHTAATESLLGGRFDVIGDSRHRVEAGTARQAPAPITEPTPTEAYYSPMLAATPERGLSLDQFDATEWAMEEKYDGVRVSLRIGAGTLAAWSRPRGAGHGLSRALHPAVISALRFLPVGYYDAELVVPGGVSTDVAATENAGRQRLVLFDVAELLGKPTIGLTYTARRSLLSVAAGALGGCAALAPSLTPSQGAVEAIWARGGEGVVLKRRAALYHPGYRSEDWIKVKARREDVFTVIGFEAGKGGPHSVLIVERVTDGKATRVKALNADWLRRADAGAITIGTLVEVEYQQETPDSFRHARPKRIIGDA